MYADDNILCFNENCNNAVFPCEVMGILNIDLNNTNLDNTTYDEDDPETIIHVKLLGWHIKLKRRKALKK